MTILAAVGAEACARLAELHARAFDRPWSAAEFEELLEQPGVAAITAEEAGRPLGLILVRVVAGEAEILTLAVAPEHRRAGLGRALVEAAAAAARGVGTDCLWLEAASDNEAALGLYRAAGFEVAGRRPAYYSRGPDAPAMDAVVMRRDLNSAAS
jgi:ribosomal-protein-alanine N-acetyltransferase